MAVAAYRGEIVHLLAAPQESDQALVHYPDGLLVVEDGYVSSCGSFSEKVNSITPTQVDGLIVPGFIDAHVHYPQLDVVASYGVELIEWLEKYTFPVEQKFAEYAHAQTQARLFLDHLLAAGTTSALVFATSHQHSAELLFADADRRKMRLITGKVLMDRNCPTALQDTPATAYSESKQLIERWHGKNRLGYAVTPRFAITSSDEQLRQAARLLDEHPGVMLQTHLAENHKEIDWVSELFSDSSSYLDVYHQFGLTGKHSVFAHSIHLSDADWQCLADTDSAIAFCPSSNMLLGSGLFNVNQALAHSVRFAFGTDVGGGSSLSILKMMDDGYRVARLGKSNLSPAELWYRATLGGAKTLGIDSYVGNFVPGKEADFVVLQPGRNQLLAQRLTSTTSLLEKLFAIALLGDERIVAETYVMGSATSSN